jgi:hypothetical protein
MRIGEKMYFDGTGPNVGICIIAVELTRASSKERIYMIALAS